MQIGKFMAKTGVLAALSWLVTWLLIACMPVAAELSDVQSQTKSATEARLSAALNNWLARASLQNSLVGLEVMQLPGGKILFTSNGNRRFVPASVAKVFVSACAFDRMGADYKYPTQLALSGEIKGDTAHGDLILQVSQDPSLEYKDIKELLGVLHARKIKRVEGRLKIAAVASGRDYFLPGWLSEDWGQEWMPVSSDLVIDRNIAPSAEPGRGLPAVSSFADANGNAFTAGLLATPELAPGWATFDVERGLVQAVRANGSGGLVITNPTAYYQALVESMIRAMGIRLGGQVHQGQELCVLSGRGSAPLSAIVRHTLHLSDNLYAQQLLRTIGAWAVAKRKMTAFTLEECGLQEMHNWLSGIGVKNSEVVLVDGCGLSRKNCVSPHSLNMVWKHMAVGGFNSPFLEQLKASGGTGGGEFRYKTGSMDSVRTISGVVKTVNGDLLALTAMVNGHSPSIRDVRAALDELSGIVQNLPPLEAEASALPRTTVIHTTEPPVKVKTRAKSRHRRRR